MSQHERSGTDGSPNSGRRRRAPKGEGHRLRGEIIAAASDLLADLGDPNQLSMRAVAAACGVTPPSIYRNFPYKQALLAAVLESRWAEFVRVIEEAASEVDDPFESLRRVGHACLGFAEEHPGHYQVLFRTAAPAGISEGSAQHPAAPGFFVLVEAIQRCLDAGARPPGGRDSTFLAVQVWLFLHGLIDLRIVQRFPFPWPPSDTLLDAVLADLGLGTRGEGGNAPADPGGISPCDRAAFHPER
jgi:AcrR family transcriptional regulator